MVFYVGKSAQLLGALPPDPHFWGFASLTLDPAGELRPQTARVPLFPLLEVATLVNRDVNLWRNVNDAEIDI